MSASRINVTARIQLGMTHERRHQSPLIDLILRWIQTAVTPPNDLLCRRSYTRGRFCVKNSSCAPAGGALDSFTGATGKRPRIADAGRSSTFRRSGDAVEEPIRGSQVLPPVSGARWPSADAQLSPLGSSCTLRGAPFRVPPTKHIVRAFRPV